MNIDPDWTPTPENINTLPEPLRKYIHALATDADPQGTIRENFILREENKLLRLECERLAGVHKSNAESQG